MISVYRSTVLVTIFAIMIAATVAGMAPANPAAWSSFQPATFNGDIRLVSSVGTSSFVTAVSPIVYTLELGVNPQIKLGDTWYHVTEVWGFYAVADTGTDGKALKFDATIPEKAGWVQDIWPNTPLYGNVGWENPSKANAITPNNSDTFEFTSLDLKGNGALLGLHVSLSEQINGGYTLFVKDIPTNAPEPSSMAGLGMAMSTMAACIYRRRK